MSNDKSTVLEPNYDVLVPSNWQPFALDESVLGVYTTDTGCSTQTHGHTRTNRKIVVKGGQIIEVIANGNSTVGDEIINILKDGIYEITPKDK